jgi:hypothetical protein
MAHGVLENDFEWRGTASRSVQRVEFSFDLKIGNLTTPDLASTYFIDTPSTPNPYLTLCLKFVDEASAKYLVGQLISPILNPK